MTAKNRLDGMRVAALAMDGFEQVELTVPMRTLKRLGAEVEVVSLRPGKIMGMNLIAPGKRVRVDRLIHEADAGDYDALLLPGGFVNPDFLRQSDAVLDFVRAMDSSGKPIAVLCHGPQVLISAKLVKGRRLTSWPAIRQDINNAGGQWVNEPLVRERNWVSSRGPQDLVQFDQGMVELFAEHRPAHPRSPRQRPSRVAPLLRWASLGALGLLAVGLGTSAALRR